MKRISLLLALVVTACGSVTGSPDAPNNPNGSGASNDGDPTTVVDDPRVDAPQPLSPNIIVDQFGYRPSAEKIAIVRAPQTGFDARLTFTPGETYRLLDAVTGSIVLEGQLASWNSGKTDSASGDKAWWFDFSSVTAAGQYYVLDVDRDVRSDVFAITDHVYRDVLTQTVRMMFYQRDGFAKDAAYAGAEWADGAAHLGPNQGPACKLYNGATLKDLRGGWWDAGDQSKYTNWANDYVLELLHAYAEGPAPFTDDFNLPESGNGIPDLLDEVKWELDWLERMQNSDGSVLSIVGQSGSPPPDTRPSHATGPCTYGPATTAATISTAAAFAYASKVYEPFLPTFAADLRARAVSAWTWASANTNVTFYNAGSVGAGEQEVDANGRAIKKLQAAVALYALTDEAAYRTAIDAMVPGTQLVSTGAVDLFSTPQQDALLDYATTSGVTQSVKTSIIGKYASGIRSANNLGMLTASPDPYLAHLYVYVWGSNQNKAMQGNTFYSVIAYNIDSTKNADAERAAERFVHYVHGVNPLGLVYLSRMEDFGAHASVSRFYHTWFAQKSDWNAAGVSKYGPPPGYLVGGPNPTYSWDGCCPNNCDGNSCGAAQPAPPYGQPPAKAYADRNDDWPLDTWQFSEPSIGYQVKYIRLLAKFTR